MIDALSASSELGDVGIVRELLEAGADPNARDRMGRTPMMNAVKQAHWDVVFCLADHGASLCVVVDSGYTALHYAAVSRKVKIIDGLARRCGFLINRVAHTNKQTPLMVAVKTGNAAGVKRLLSWNAFVNTADDQGRSALHWAVYNADVQVIDILISAGADVNSVMWTNHMTPLCLVLSRKTYRAWTVNRLLKAGANSCQCDDLGRTPLWYAARQGHWQVVQYLLAMPNGCRPVLNMVDINGISPLCKAVEG